MTKKYAVKRKLRIFHFDHCCLSNLMDTGNTIPLNQNMYNENSSSIRLP